MIIARSPLRISLGGGGTDLPSYYRQHGGFLIAAAIDRAGPARESLFLAKLCLALGAQMTSIESIVEAIRAAEEDLERPAPG